MVVSTLWSGDEADIEQRWNGKRREVVGQINWVAHDENRFIQEKVLPLQKISL